MKNSINATVLVFYAVFIAFASLRPADGVSIGSWDKFFHLASYAVFAVLAYRVLHRPRPYMYLCIVIVVYGGLMEFAQSFIPGRDMSVYDFLANTLGVVLGAIMAVKLGKIFSNRLLRPSSELR